MMNLMINNGINNGIDTILALGNIYLIYFHGFYFYENKKSVEKIAQDYSTIILFNQWLNNLFFYFYSDYYYLYFGFNLLATPVIGFTGYALDYYLNMNKIISYSHIFNIIVYSFWMMNISMQYLFISMSSPIIVYYGLIQVITILISDYFLNQSIDKKIQTAYP